MYDAKATSAINKILLIKLYFGNLKSFMEPFNFAQATKLPVKVMLPIMIAAKIVVMIEAIISMIINCKQLSIIFEIENMLLDCTLLMTLTWTLLY